MKFSLIHPSRSRPEKSKTTIRKWLNSANDIDNIQLVICCDEDDPYHQSYHLGNYYPSTGEGILSKGKSRSAIDAINSGARLSKGDILIVVSDDTDCPEHWDKILLDAIGQNTDFVMKVADGIQRRIITMPIMDRTYYNRFGYIYNPIYSHSWCDTELTEVAYRLGRIIVRNDIVFPHLHPEVTKEPKDDLYKQNDLTHDRDRPLYESRKRINFGL